MNQTQPEQSGQAVRMLQNHLKNGTFRELWRDWKWILAFNRGHWGSILLYTLLGLGSSALALVSSVISKKLIDSIQFRDLEGLLSLVPFLLLSAAVSVGFTALNSRFSARLSMTMQNHVQHTVFDRLIHSEWMAISRYSSGDLLNRFSADISTVSGCAVSLLPGMLIQFFTILATLAVIVYYDPVMALIGCASTPLLFLVSHRLITRQREHNRTIRTISSDLSAFQSETFRNIDTLKGFGVEDQITGQLRDNQERYKQAMLDYNSFSIRTHALLSTASSLVEYLVLGYCLWQLWRGNMVFSTMVFFLQQRSTLQGAFSSLISQVPRILSGSISAERLRELTELEKEKPVRASVESLCSVQVKDVTLAYNEDKNVLEHVTLHAAPGETIALVGPSGQGKTTLLRLLLGLIRPVSGEAELILPGGVSRALDASTRHSFSYVPQGNTLLAGTVAQNLLIAAPDATEEQMLRALERACALEFVEKLPQGIHSPIGEGGKGLSEGQAQRIAIARALLRNAPVLLLDEVTSALDIDTERRVLRNLMDREMTCILTTHRPSVLSMCTRVYRVENGRVTQLGQQEIDHLTANVT